jgi:DNA-binding CsgD family transcriptional regulator
MNQDTFEKIKQPEFYDAIVLVREKLKQQLSQKEYELLYISLDPKLVTCIRILDMLETSYCDYYEIANTLGYSLNTIKHYLYALESIGFDISAGKVSVKDTGRPRVIKRK